jgi:hypothetical protein
MDELPPKAAALLRAARHDHNPTRADSERVRTALAAALLAPPVSEVPNEATNAGQGVLSGSKGASGLLSASWIKGVAVLSVVGSASLWVYLDGAPRPARAPSAVSAPSSEVTWRAEAPSEVPAPARGAHAADREVQTPGPSGAVAPAVDGRAGSDAPESSGAGSEDALQARPSPIRRMQRVRAAKSESAVASAEAAGHAQTGDTLAEGELVLMRRAIAQLNAGSPRAALERLSQHAVRYPNGVMSEERDGLRAIALCRDGDPVQGKASALSFLRLYPDSAMAGRVRAACKESAP